MDWREYQEQTAELFRSIGCTAEIEKEVAGVRGVHKVDVWVTGTIYGITHRWVVECKYCNSPIRKEKVLTLQRIVDDVGADRGFLLSHSGFQAGAVSCARQSNITLSSLEYLQVSFQEEILEYSLSLLEKNKKNAVFSLINLARKSVILRLDGFISLEQSLGPRINGVSFHEAMNMLSVVGDGITAVRGGEACFELVLPNGERKVIVQDAPQFVAQASEIVSLCEKLTQNWENGLPNNA